MRNYAVHFCSFVSFRYLHCVMTGCLSVSVQYVCIQQVCDCQPLCLWVCVKMCVCVMVACACKYLLIFLLSKLYFLLILSRYWCFVSEEASVYFCTCKFACIWVCVCVCEAELIVLHESKQQVALTLSKQQACSYFDIDSHCAFTVKCGCIGGKQAESEVSTKLPEDTTLYCLFCEEAYCREMGRQKTEP